MPHRLFVYGTLRRGEVNHHLLAGARPLGETRTLPTFTLLDLGGFPGMVAGGHTAIIGELYEVAPQDLPALDALEEHPEVYVRTPVVLEDGTEAEAYVLRRPAGREITSGDWLRR